MLWEWRVCIRWSTTQLDIAKDQQKMLGCYHITFSVICLVRHDRSENVLTQLCWVFFSFVSQSICRVLPASSMPVKIYVQPLPLLPHPLCYNPMVYSRDADIASMRACLRNSKICGLSVALRKRGYRLNTCPLTSFTKCHLLCYVCATQKTPDIWRS